MTQHLIHIGYPKTGSTFLQRWFASHPQLGYCASGIAGFRDVYALARESVAPGEPAYRVTSSERLSAPPGTSGQTMAEYAPGTSMLALQAQVCHTLQSLFPSARILIITRGFRSMILSSYSQYVRSGGVGDLEALFATLRETSSDMPLSDLDPWNYDAVVGMYVRSFGAENVIVMPYELLRDDADRFLRELSGRLQLESVPAPRDRVNVSLSRAELHWYPRVTRLVSRFAPRLLGRYVTVPMNNRLRLPIRLLSAMSRRRQGPLTVPDEVVERYRGLASSLRGNPLYAPYLADYLL